MIGRGREGSERDMGSLTHFQRVSQSFPIKKPHSWASTGSLQGFYRMFWNFYRMFYNFLHNVPKSGFWSMDGGKKVKEWVWRWNRGVRRSRFWWMELRSDKDGWICSRRDKAMLHNNMESRSTWGNVAKVRQGSEMEDEAGRLDGVWVDGEVWQALCKLFFKLNKQTRRKPMT